MQRRGRSGNSDKPTLRSDDRTNKIIARTTDVSDKRRSTVHCWLRADSRARPDTPLAVSPPTASRSTRRRRRSFLIHRICLYSIRPNHWAYEFRPATAAGRRKRLAFRRALSGGACVSLAQRSLAVSRRGSASESSFFFFFFFPRSPFTLESPSRCYYTLAVETLVFREPSYRSPSRTRDSCVTLMTVG